MISCNYNGWADVPEEEREGIDAFEASRPVPALIPIVRPSIPRMILVRKAA